MHVQYIINCTTHKMHVQRTRCTCNETDARTTHEINLLHFFSLYFKHQMRNYKKLDMHEKLIEVETNK